MGPLICVVDQRRASAPNEANQEINIDHWQTPTAKMGQKVGASLGHTLGAGLEVGV